jgi:hypothetical protein
MGARGAQSVFYRHGAYTVDKVALRMLQSTGGLSEREQERWHQAIDKAIMSYGKRPTVPDHIAEFRAMMEKGA